MWTPWYFFIRELSVLNIALKKKILKCIQTLFHKSHDLSVNTLRSADVSFKWSRWAKTKVCDFKKIWGVCRQGFEKKKTFCPSVLFWLEKRFRRYYITTFDVANVSRVLICFRRERDFVAGIKQSDTKYHNRITGVLYDSLLSNLKLLTYTHTHKHKQKIACSAGTTIMCLKFRKP